MISCVAAQHKGPESRFAGIRYQRFRIGDGFSQLRRFSDDIQISGSMIRHYSLFSM
jgi:hypothetical protein